MTDKDFIALVKEGREDEVRAELQAYPDLASAQEDGVSAILLAVYSGQATIARAIADARCGNVDIFESAALGDQHVLADLLKKHPDQINDHSADGFTPLGLAAYFGHREFVQALLKAGADPNIASKNSIGVVPLHSALSNKHTEIARDLVEAGTDVNTPSRFGYTPLHYVAEFGDWQMADFLLMHGASTSQVDNIGETAAMKARTKGFTGLADILE